MLSDLTTDNLAGFLIESPVNAQIHSTQIVLRFCFAECSVRSSAAAAWLSRVGIERASIEFIGLESEWDSVRSIEQAQNFEHSRAKRRVT